MLTAYTETVFSIKSTMVSLLLDIILSIPVSPLGCDLKANHCLMEETARLVWTPSPYLALEANKLRYQISQRLRPEQREREKGKRGLLTFGIHRLGAY